MSHPQVRRFQTREGLVKAAAGLVGKEVHRTLARQSLFSLVLSGGRTPLPVYERLAGAGLPWERIHLFWGDERLVPAADPASNFGAAARALLDRIAIPAANVHPMAGLGPDPAQAAEAYQRELEGFFATPGRPGDPVFDLVLLGLGADGHTASLFPGHPALAEREKWVTAVEKPLGSPPAPRISLSLPILNQARLGVFLAAGQDKLKLVQRILALGPPPCSSLPAALVRPRRLIWLVAEE